MKDAFKKLPKLKQTTILKTATRIFAQQGFYQASIADICQTAGISNGALYVYFKNKEALYLACAEHGIKLMSEKLFAQYAEVEGGFFEKLTSIFNAAIKFAQRNQDLVAVYLDLGSVSYNRFAGILSETVEKSALQYHLEFIEQAQQNGELTLKLKAKSAAYIVDNHLMMLVFSIVSEHYEKRFYVYFGDSDTPISPEARVPVVMESLKELLSQD